MFNHFFCRNDVSRTTIRRNGFLDRRVCQFRHTHIFFVPTKGVEPLYGFPTPHPKCGRYTISRTSAFSDLLYILIGI